MSSLDAQFARCALELYELIGQLTDQVLYPADIDLLTPMRTNLQLAVDRFDNAAYEVERHGRSYPDGPPRLRLAGDPTPAPELREAKAA
jgi:hypothetical protein